MESLETLSWQQSLPDRPQHCSWMGITQLEESWYGESSPRSLPQKGSLVPGNPTDTNLANSVL